MNQNLKKIVEEIGVIIGVTGVAPIILSPLGMDTFIISLLSAFLFLTVLTLYHREFLNKNVQSGVLIIGVLVVVVTTSILIHIYYIKSPFKAKFEKSNDFLSTEIGQRIKSSKDEIWFFGQSFHISAGDQTDELLNVLESGVDVKYLIIDPRNEKNVHLIAKDYGSSFNTTLNELKLYFSHLTTIQNRLKASQKQQKGNLEIRLLNSLPFFRGYFFDPKHSKNSAYIVPYMNTYSSAQVPGYLFENYSYNSVPRKYLSSVLRAWNKSSLVKADVISEIADL